jgi:ubiquinol-cytochrome c reductase iron-sulfur subunit
MSRARTQTAVAVLLGLAGLAGGGFVVAYVLGANTQWLGLSLGGALALLAVALIIAGKRVVPQEVVAEERAELVREEDIEHTAQEFEKAGEGVSRRRLLGGAAGLAGAGLTAAVVTPLASLGPKVGDRLKQTPWHRGRRLVDDHGVPITADDLEIGSFLTAFPEGADPRELGSPVVVVQIPVGALRLPPGRAGWAPEGILAFSKICTHAGCAISLFRYPTYEPTSKPPGLVCPCHYSTFDVRQGGKVVFGPAARSLPQLPLVIGPRRELLAGGGFSGAIGPSWWGVGHA